MRIAFVNPQGNFDPMDSYWTEHADFGGQLVYVKEVALALAALGVEVDIITRQIIDHNWRGFESAVDHYPGSLGVRIIRVPFGGRSFLSKEQLWPFIPEFVSGIIRFYQQEGNKPDFFSTHYADGGVSGALLQARLGVPFSFTAHALGAQKMERLQISRATLHSLNRKYRFARRIEAERAAMANSAVNIVSTNHERFKQYSHPYYHQAIDVKDDRRFAVVSPGVNTDVFNQIGQTIQDQDVAVNVRQVLERDIDSGRQHLPCIIMASRLDWKKNHIGLVKAYALNQPLQDRANLVITLRGIDHPFKDYSMARPEEKEILDEIMEIIHRHNLAGKVSMFSLNSQRELAACYRVFAKGKSVFALVSHYEPFGLGIIEALASGLPVVATNRGGAGEVLQHGDDYCGILIEPTMPESISEGLLRLVSNDAFYSKLRATGLIRVAQHYTWQRTGEGYLACAKDALSCNWSGKRAARRGIHRFFTNPEDTDVEVESLLVNGTVTERGE